MTLTAVYEEVPESDGGGYVAYAEELPGAISEGDTLDEARDNLRDAIELLLEANPGTDRQTHSGQEGYSGKNQGLSSVTMQSVSI